VEGDKVMRRFQIGATVENDYQSVDAPTRAMLDAYAAGVNAFIESTDALPIEYKLLDARPEPWHPRDSFAVFKVRHIMMGVFEGKLWRAKLVNTLGTEKAAALLGGHPPGDLVIAPPGGTYKGPVLNGLEELSRNLEGIRWLQDEPDSGSNNWAVHGSRTSSGKPFLAGDAHRLLDTPNCYYQNHIACKEFDVMGISFPGVPGFAHFGHNPHVAWCVTHAQADYQDLYIERFSPEGASRYEFRGQWKEAEVRRERIKVKDETDQALEVTLTRHGPIIAGGPGKGYGLAFQYTATAFPYRGFECLLPMMKAASVDELNESMRKWVDPCNNLVSADVHGNIAYLHRGQVPIRSMSNAWMPVPGWSGDHEWQGSIPFEKLSRLRNPSTGFIVSANNRIPDQKYPYYIALSYAPEYRARRIYERLENLTGATMEDMRSIHGDSISIPAQVFIKLIAEAKLTNEFSIKAQSMLVRWNGAMERDAVAPTIYSAFRVKLLHKIIGSRMGPLVDVMFNSTGRGAPRHLGELASQIVHQAKTGDAAFLPQGVTWGSIAGEALNEAVAYLRQRLGGDMETWKWNTIHRTSPKHPISHLFPGLENFLNPPPVSMGGDGDTPYAAGYSPGRPFDITLLSVVRYIFDISDWDNSGWAVPLGVSGHPGSRHYADQASIWGNLELIPMRYTWDRVKAEAAVPQILEPR
ncbi:MAG TPA: penicillin acylase family protein, partial [Thermodesulfobacteriota bacterium]|nr:penicillin acylase family protein [Thermodesulfobacteriota bacterium]